jgi:hypothetical protein
MYHTWFSTCTWFLVGQPPLWDLHKRESQNQLLAGQGGTPATTSEVSKVEYNLEYQDRFQKYKEMGLPTWQVKAFYLKQKLKLSWNHALKKSMCISFHIKGVCNNRCGSSVDHKPHTKQQDDELEKWCHAHYHRAEPPALMLTGKDG